jgi:hypothetical protein
MRTLTGWCLLTAFLLTTAGARVAPSSLDDLIADSDAIVIAKVTELLPTSTSDRELVYASATVEKTLKGSLRDSFLFRASSAGICDSSGAVKDETALFFLGRNSDGTFYVKGSGRGRLPLSEIDGKFYVTFSNMEVPIPDSLPTIAGPEPKLSFIISVALEDMETMISRHREQRQTLAGI